ncbi:MAG TPA: class I SAM-dependent methyltransferase [Planctomycetota bacterium]|nr:class I SAM-dependent methyltransferase [Planctomycetota bacterium]
MTDGYALLDSGDGRKLERVGPVLLDRQATAAFWRPRRPRAEWDKVDAYHHRSDQGGGRWELRRALPASWDVEYGGLTLRIKPTGFGHLGLFAEHADAWTWLRETCRAATARGAPPQVLNLFAYTGGATLACAQGGASVCHVDAAKGVVDWARENAALNDLAERPLRWIVDDVVEFLRREERRGRAYDGVVLDPPSFGRGARGQVWKIEESVGALLDQTARVLSKTPAFVFFSCHSPGFTPLVLENLLRERFDLAGCDVASGEMSVAEADGGRRLPAGAFARFRRASSP